MLTLTPTHLTPAVWDRIEASADATVDRAWLQFILDTQPVTAVAAEVRDGRSVVGHFVGMTFSRFGVRILGSPFPGWNTDYMGFALAPEVPRWEALRALPAFAFGELGCLYLEVRDRYLTAEDGRRAGLPWEPSASFETDLGPSEDDLFARMDSACRRCVRKAAKSGVVVEEAVDDDVFVAEYYEQLTDVFAKQGLRPTYGADRVRALLRRVRPTGRLLCLRARGPDGACLATGIYPRINDRAYFWGNASFRSGQHLRPNEALHWHAIRHWKSAGVRFFDWGGGGAYKAKYGCTPIVVPRFYRERVPFLRSLRQGAAALFRRRQRLPGSPRVTADPR